MNDLVIRRAVMGDLGGVAKLVEELDELHREAMPWLLQRVDEPPSTESLEPFVSKEDHAMFVAAGDGGVLAGAVYLFVRQPPRAPILKPAVVAEIDTLVVSSAYRRRGLGTRLVNAALGWANAAGATRTELGIYEFNEPARRFWATVGFETLSRRLVVHSSNRG